MDQGPKWINRMGRLITLGLMLAILGGCKKQLANLALKSAVKRKAEAEQNQDDVHASASAIAVADLINATQQQLNAQNFTEAHTNAKDAAAKAKEHLELTKSTRSNFLKSEANRWIDIVNINDGRAENPALYQQILEGNQAGLEAFDKQKWDPAISSLDKVVQDSQFLLENLQRKSREGLAEIDKLREDLVAEGAEEHFPESVTEIDDFRKRIDELIEAKLDYRTALNTRDQARQSAEAGILKTKEVKGDKQLREIENLLGEAVVKGADIYAARSLTNVSREFDDLLKQFYEAKYDSVLSRAPLLKPKALELIAETERESANVQLKAVALAITSLTEGQAKIYLPGRVESIEELRAQAKEKFDAQAYLDTKEICGRALDEEKKVINSFNSLTQQHISDASGQLGIAQGVFSRMQEIFSHKAPGPLSGEDAALENSKEARRDELRARLQHAAQEVAIAQIRREERTFAEAIEIARAVVIESEDVIQGIYHVVAHNAILELDNSLSLIEVDGGRQYASTELNKAEALLQDARNLVGQGDFREAVFKLAETKSQQEDLRKELVRYGWQMIKQAEESIAKAKAEGADIYKKGITEQVSLLVDEAKRDLGAPSDRNKKKSIERAIEAIKGAEAIGDESIRLWAQDELRRTDIILAKASDAGAAGYAASIFDDAVNLKNNAVQLIETGNMIEAQEVAFKAATTADKALHAQVDNAKDAIADAKRVGGWKYDPERLAAAGINERQARELLDAGQYNQSHAYAIEAYDVAQDVSLTARRAGFKDRMDALKDKVTDIGQTGVIFYQSADFTNVIGEMRKLSAEFEPVGFEEAAQQLELLEARLEGLMESTPDVLQEVVDHMNDRLTQLETRGAKGQVPDLVAEASQRIKFAQLDFQNEEYRSSYENSKDVLSLLDDIDLRMDEVEYDRAISKRFTEFSRLVEGFSPVLNLGAPVLLRLGLGPHGRGQVVSILQASEPSEFRQDLVDLAAQIELLDTPPTRRSIQNATLDMLETAKQAASGFEKLLILDQYTNEDVRKIVEASYIKMRTARNHQQDIQRLLVAAEPNARQASIQKILQRRP